MGHEVTVASYGEGIVRFGGDLYFVFRPFFKHEARSRVGFHRARLPFLIRAAANNGAAVIWLGRKGDGVERQWVFGEVGDEITMVGHGEGVCGI